MPPATSFRARAIITPPSNPTSPLTPASTTKAASTSCPPGAGNPSIVARRLPLQRPRLLPGLLSHASTLLIRRIRARLSLMGRDGASVGLILRLMLSCLHRRPSLVLGLPRHRLRALIARRLRRRAMFPRGVRMRRHQRAVPLPVLKTWGIFGAFAPRY